MELKKSGLVDLLFRGSVKHGEGDIVLCLHKHIPRGPSILGLKRDIACYGSDTAAIQPNIMKTAHSDVI